MSITIYGASDDPIEVEGGGPDLTTRLAESLLLAASVACGTAHAGNGQPGRFATCMWPSCAMDRALLVEAGVMQR